MSRRSKVESDSLFLRGVAIKPPILNSRSTAADDGKVVLYFTKAALTCGYANKLDNGGDQPAMPTPSIPTTAIPTLLPPVTVILEFRQFWLGLACVGIAGVGIAICTQLFLLCV